MKYRKFFRLLFIFYFLLLNIHVSAQSNTGIHFQGIARNTQGFVIPNKKMNIQLSIMNDTNKRIILYQEVKSINTNIVGLFFTTIGIEEKGKIITQGNFESIPWNLGVHFLEVAIDFENDLNFVVIGTELIPTVPLSIFSKSTAAEGIIGIVPILQGGTGVNNLKAFKTLLEIDKINNTPDSIKIITKSVLSLINEKLNKSDTTNLSNRINLKLSKIDTLGLSNRINKKVSLEDITDSLIYKKLGYIPSVVAFGTFYDTSKQIAVMNTATSVIWGFSGVSQHIALINNSNQVPTKIAITHPGTYKLCYMLQCIKSDLGNDEMSVWIRRNGGGYSYTQKLFIVIGGGVKNSFSGFYNIELGDKDYVELFYSVKNNNTSLISSALLSNPSRPGTPSAYLTIEKVN